MLIHALAACGWPLPQRIHRDRTGPGPAGA
ncbi:hypothetical protein HNR61_001630 [Actinomadura namibiensis]|uniref:Uncharacterized protein n=1 Tax=Actinomadura namibiensis TaxID=182080 RepID=A0A7W3LKW7_ACTNM|nr:hypothetical protein [Actinomadura namibiensis]